LKIGMIQQRNVPKSKAGLVQRNEWHRVITAWFWLQKEE
jgi:hypothetical protein